MRRLCWTLNHAIEGIGGQCPQHQRMSDGYDFNAPNSVHKLPHDALPSFEPNFDTVIVHGHAKLTDLLSSAPIPNHGYLVSPKLRGLLERFTLPSHRWYPVPMTHRNKQVAGYCWLQLPQPGLSLTKDSSIDDVESAIYGVPELAALDLLRLYRPSRFAYCFISDPLRRAMEAAGIAGVRFGSAKLFRSTGGHGPSSPAPQLGGA